MKRMRRNYPALLSVGEEVRGAEDPALSLFTVLPLYSDRKFVGSDGEAEQKQLKEGTAASVSRYSLR